MCHSGLNESSEQGLEGSQMQASGKQADRQTAREMTTLGFRSGTTKARRRWTAKYREVLDDDDAGDVGCWV